MTQLFNFIVFLLFKAAEIGSAYYLLKHFNFRFDIVVLMFYGFLSIFQLLFFAVQNISKHKNTTSSVLFLRYTPIIVLVMESVIIATSGYYLFLQENDLSNLMYIGTAIIQIAVIFYPIIVVLFGVIIKKTKIYLKSTSVLPYLLLLLIGIGTPLAYLLTKMLLFKKPITTMDIYLAIATLGVNLFVSLFLFWQKVIQAKYTAKIINKFSVGVTNNTITISEGNEIGYIQSALKELANKINDAKKGLSLLNNYTSNDIKRQIQENGLPEKGELKTAVVSTFYFSLADNSLPPNIQIQTISDIGKIIGEYADDYDAYPMFSPNYVTLVFGAPFYYEHEKLNALESAVKIASDIEKYSGNQEIEINLNIGIFSGKVICGTVLSRGREYPEYVVFGETVTNSEKFAALAKRLNAKILSCDMTIEKLKGKFFVDKSYKLKIGNTIIKANQIRV